MIDFGKVREMSIPEGMVAQIMSGGVLLWKKPSAGARFVGYTGTYTESSVEIDGAAYTLYTLTTSGTLTVEGDGALFWMCGGGGGGASGDYSDRYGGGGGGGGYLLQDALSGGKYAVVIGAGGAKDTDGNATNIGTAYNADGGKTGYSDFVYSSYGGNGGSGGGSGAESGVGSVRCGSGQGISTLPFGSSDLEYHCAGGGGGGVYYKSSSGSVSSMGAGAGGSNGSNGGSFSGGGYDGGAGGEKGGGKGGDGSASTYKGSNGTFYGAGGGGGGAYRNASTSKNYEGAGGSGYQGVVYIAIPA
ncbi:MAG: hypothetical protein IJE08_04450 [Clostridia bacterium]|nr:hypothetical protein [Clostridia bacterium]